MEPAVRSIGITIHPKLFRPANFVETAIGNIRSSLLIGAVLVAIVLFFFLADVRTALISMTAIPLSLLGAIIVLTRFGVSLNTLTLGGLAIAIGEVVDDAIIDAENIVRRLRENRLTPGPRPVFQVGFSQFTKSHARLSELAVCIGRRRTRHFLQRRMAHIGFTRWASHSVRNQYPQFNH